MAYSGQASAVRMAAVNLCFTATTALLQEMPASLWLTSLQPKGKGRLSKEVSLLWLAHSGLLSGPQQ